MGYCCSKSKRQKPAIDFVAELYQEVATQHFLENDHAALFAGCGLGKTAATLAALNELFHDGACVGALVIAPMRVANLTWVNEVAKWKQFRWMKVVSLRTKEGVMKFRRGEAHIYTINYEQLPKFAWQELRRLRKLRKPFPFDTIVWDELSKAKKYNSVRVAAMRKYWPHIKRHWGLTGSPQPNSQLDLFAQYRILDGGKRLGNNYFRFRKKYFFTTDEYSRKWYIRKRQAMLLEQAVADMTLVLKSEDYLDIPEVTVEDVDVVLPEKAKKMYRDLQKNMFVRINSDTVIEGLNSAVLLNKLLQITCGSIYGSDKEVIEIHDAKMKALQKIYKEEDAPMMIAYQYKHEEDRIARAIPGSVKFSDAKSHKQQDALVDLWNDGKVPALIVYAGSVGHGLNLQDGGALLVWVSLSWSYELFDQLNARLARKGQKLPTRIIRLLVKGSADHAVAEALRHKESNQDRLLNALESLSMLGKL